MSLTRINQTIVECEKCPRLRRHCRTIAEKKRKAYSDWDYWGRPVPSFGDKQARILIIGLAPAAHGANRTGRMFTGDNSGLWLYRGLHQAGLANQPQSTDKKDGLKLNGVWVSAAAHCAPPENKPSTLELKRCFGYLRQEWEALADLRVVLATGGIAFRIALQLVEEFYPLPKPRPKFGHGVEAKIGSITVMGTYHPSQQNTFTKRLTEPMLKSVLVRAKKVAGIKKSFPG